MNRLIALVVLLALPLRAAVPTYTPELQARVFDRAWSLVAKHYWDRSRTGEAWADARDHFRPLAVAAPDRPAFSTLLGEMLASLGDSHVYAIDPLQISIGKARDAGRSQQGFGLTMVPDDSGRWLITRIAPGSSAAKAGVEIGWEVRTVNGKPIDIDYQPNEGDEASFDLADEHGTRHLLRLAAAPEQAQLVRRATRLPGNILFAGLDGFDAGADRWLARAIAEGPPPAAIVLDLRGNGGGDADVIAKVAGLFFVEDRPLVRRIDRRENVQKVRGMGVRAYRGPLALLIGPDSASGAEALAAVVDESGRGTTIGERTAGALTGASDYKLPDGGELSVAEFDIRTPDGRRLEGVGLEPKIAVKPSLADLRAGRDPVLERALQLLRAGQVVGLR